MSFRLATICMASSILGTSGVAAAQPLGAAEADRLRITEHFERVEQELLTADTTALTRTELRERARNIERLRAYRERGEFPRNRDVPGPRVPTFIDHEGRACAVGALMLASGHDTLAHAIARDENHDRIPHISTEGLADWVAQSGLTAAECARIQPSYCEEDKCSPDDEPVCGASGKSYLCLAILEECTEDAFVSEGECPYDGPPESTTSTGSGPPITTSDDGCTTSGRTNLTTSWLFALALLASRLRRS